MLRRGSEQNESKEKKKRVRERKELLKQSHLKQQVDTQTQFVLPAVPKLTKRGQPGANSCFS